MHRSGLLRPWFEANSCCAFCSLLEKRVARDIIGAIAGGGKGAGIGAGVGAAGGAIYQGATKGKQVKIPAATRLDFELEQPVTVFVIPRPSNSAEGQQ